MSRPQPPGTVAYVLKKFPVLSETFVLNEILAIEDHGVPVHIFALERPNDPRFHLDLGKLRAHVTYVPDVLELWTLLQRNRRAFSQQGRLYSAAVARAIASGRPTLLWRSLQAGYIATEAKRLKIAHFHAHFANRPTTVARLAAAMTGLRFSFTAHAVDIFKNTVNERVLAAKIHAARFVITVSEYNRAHLSALANGAGDRVLRIYNGIDLERFAPNGRPPWEPFTIVCVARLVEKKGVDVLIEACALLRDRGAQFRCLIVGKGRLRSTLEALIAARRLRDHVTMLGAQAQHEVLARYHSSHVYVLPCMVGPDGNRDGLPVSIVEALACGVPVITTPMTGNPEVVRDGENGLLVPENDSTKLADALESLICDRDRYEAIRERARASVVDTFDIQQAAAALSRHFLGGAA